MLTRITAPASEPVSLAEVKNHLAIIGTADDDLLTRLISSAVASFDGAEGRLGRCMISQEWRLDISGSFAPGIVLPMPPVISVDAVAYVDSAGATQTLDPADYFAAGLGSTHAATVFPTTRWPSARSASVSFTAGFGDADAVPADIKDGILAVIGARYAWRESEIMASGSLSSNPQFTDTIDRWRIRGFG
jgi:uncharacterized phiE125 gp8 family phage protein